MVRKSTPPFHIVGALLAMIIGMTATGAVYADKMTTEETRKLTMKYLEVMHSGEHEDIKRFGDYYAEDIEAHYHTTGPSGRYFFSREAFVNFYLNGAKSLNYEHGIKVDRHWVVVQDNVAVVRNTTRAHRYGGPFNQEYIHVYYWEDGEIVRMEAFNNGEAKKSARDIGKRNAANKAALKVGQ